MDFPDLSAEEVHAAVAAKWDLSGPLPVPRGDWLRCPVCGSDAMQIRHWFWHARDHAVIPWRCDLSVKCAACSAVWLHGIAVPADYYDRHSERSHKRLIGWRDGRRMLEETHAEA